jgi:MoaA/NifB/PqqE/SkfB family radical SAM enzyme
MRAVPADRIAVLFLQPQCDMTCLFCATEDGFQALTLDQGGRMLRDLRAQGVGRVILGGGEPFAWKPGPLALARIAKDLDFHVQIGTNGLHPPEGFAESPSVDRYILPLESAHAAVHDRLRLHPGGHHRVVMARLQELARAGKEVTISTVVTRHNLAGLEELGAFLAGFQGAGGRLHAWHLYRLLHVGRGGSLHGPSLAVAPEAYRDACARVRLREPALRILKRPDMRRSATVGFFWRQGNAVRSLSPFPIAFGE